MNVNTEAYPLRPADATQTNYQGTKAKKIITYLHNTNKN